MTWSGSEAYYLYNHTRDFKVFFSSHQAPFELLNVQPAMLWIHTMIQADRHMPNEQVRVQVYVAYLGVEFDTTCLT